jgi:hypothetical protein
MNLKLLHKHERDFEFSKVFWNEFYKMRIRGNNPLICLLFRTNIIILLLFKNVYNLNTGNVDLIE